MNITKIFGPPGTGKTTTLLGEVEGALDSGIHPDRIGYLTFTKKAAAEGVERACSKFNLLPQDLPYFRTIHSLMYQLLGLSRNQVMGIGNYKEFGEWLGVDISGMTVDAEDGLPMGGQEGDKCLRIHHLARNRLVDLRSEWERSGEDIDWLSVEQFARGYDQWRGNRNLLDFTDMLEQCPDTPKFELLIIDEAQDLTPLQWKVARNLMSKADRILLAGDDDQAIYNWAGADADLFIKAPGSIRVLEKSYRLPRAIWELSQGIVSGIHHRVAKDWAPRDEQGMVEQVESVEHLPLESGEWMLLARNKFLLGHYTEHLKERGVLFSSKGSATSLSEDLARSIIGWEQLRKGGRISGDDACGIYGYMVAGTQYERGNKARLSRLEQAPIDMAELRDHFGLLEDRPWFEAMPRIGDGDREYIREALRSGEKLLHPRIHVSTIHGVKGGECDNVVLLPDMAYRTHQGYEEDPCSERRVFYVGATRARHNLWNLSPISNLGVDFIV